MLKSSEGTHDIQRSSTYRKIYTDVLPSGLIFVYQSPLPPLKPKYHQCEGRSHFDLLIQVQSLCNLLKRDSTIIDDSVMILLSFHSSAH